MIKLSSTMRVWGALAGVFTFGAMTAGCAQDDATADEARDTGQVTGELVGSVALSPTHTVRFWDYGDGLARIEESFHADQDRDAPLTLDRMSLAGRPLVEVYEIVAAEKADANVASRLRAIDAVAARNALAHPPAGAVATPALLKASAGSSPMPLARPEPVVSAGVPGVEERQGAGTCTEPNWNWAGDSSWFAAHFCNDLINNWLCDTNLFGWESWGFYGWLNYFKAQDFNQSFCVGNTFLVKREIDSLGGSTVGTILNVTVPTRTVQTNVWNASGKVAFYAKVSSSSRFGLAIDQNETFY